jgi:hypothetical protein
MEIAWHTSRYHYRPRLQIHIKILEVLPNHPRYKATDVDRIPCTNGRPNRATEPNDQNIFKIIRQYTAKRLGRTNALAEFAYNNSVTSAHGMTPFYANYCYHPSAGTAPTETNTLSVSSVAYGHWM